MPPKNQAVPDPSESAPWYKIPNVQVVSVEHPCVVRNVDKAVQTLGGDQAIKTFLRYDHAEKPIHLKFHPEDPFSQPILSVNTQTNNVLLKITVPRRTGRKRKRGSNDPFVEDLNEPPVKKSARYLLQSLQANESTYEIEPIASIPVVHIFRTMPDLAYSTSQSPFLNQLRDKVLPFQYPLLSDFKLDPARGLANTEIIPPPSLSTMAYPSNYAYRQNPAIKAFIDPTTGVRRLFNTQAPARIHTIRCQWDTPASQIPTTISPTAPPRIRTAQLPRPSNHPPNHLRPASDLDPPRPRQPTPRQRAHLPGQIRHRLRRVRDALRPLARHLHPAGGGPALVASLSAIPNPDAAARVVEEEQRREPALRGRLAFVAAGSG